MNRNEDALAICPFYETADSRMIRCESCVQDARLYFQFPEKDGMIAFKREHCDGHQWDRCPYAQLLLKDWEDRHGKI